MFAGAEGSSAFLLEGRIPPGALNYQFGAHNFIRSVYHVYYVLSRPATIDVHDQAHGLQLALNSIKADSKIGYDDRLAIIEFDTACAAEGLSLLRRIHYLRLLAQLARNMGKPLKDAEKQDIVRLLSRLEPRGYSEWSMHDFKVALKKYYRWLRGSEEYPPEVKWVKTTTKNNHKKLPEEVLTEAEVRALVEAADNPRDRAFVLVLYEFGCRAAVPARSCPPG